MKRIYRILIVLCLPLLWCGPVEAQHAGPYIGALAGGNVLVPTKGSDDLGTLQLTFKPGFLGSAVIGWDFEPGNPAGEGRVELEYTRRSNQLDRAKFVEGSFKGGGTETADSLLVNFFGVFHENRPYSPYAGLGVGAVRIDASNLQITGQPVSRGSAVVFAYQLGAGIDYALTDHLNLDFGYRLFSSASATFSEASGKKIKTDYTSHSALFGVRLGF